MLRAYFLRKRFYDIADALRQVVAQMRFVYGKAPGNAPILSFIQYIKNSLYINTVWREDQNQFTILTGKFNAQRRLPR